MLFGNKRRIKFCTVPQRFIGHQNTVVQNDDSPARGSCVVPFADVIVACDFNDFYSHEFKFS